MAANSRSYSRRPDISFCFIIEDDYQQNKLLSSTVRHEGFQVKSFKKGVEVLVSLKSMSPEIVFLDLGLPDMDGMTLIPSILKESPHARIIVLTGDDSVRNAVKALQLGARHYLVKPWDHAELLLILDRESRAYYQSKTMEPQQSSTISTSSSLMEKISSSVKKLACSAETAVFIEGETGVGKEVLSREIHSQTGCTGDFVAFNCASLPGELIESELFGHEKGAFTGAVTTKRGMVELAKNGTLLLDEITEMPLILQSKLLRFLQEHTYRPIGSNKERECPCRVIATTNRKVQDALDGKLLRPDLFYRLAVVHLIVPPLRKRKEDIIQLAQWLLIDLQRTIPGEVRGFAEESYSALVNHTWPGNVRELRNRIERALVLGSSSAITPLDLDLVEKTIGFEPIDRTRLPQPNVKQNSEEPSKKDLTTDVILNALEENEGNISRTARKLGMARHHLRYLLKKRHLTK